MSAKLSNPKNLIALVLVGVVVVVAGAWFLLVSPERSKVGTLDNQIASVQKQIDERQAALRTCTSERPTSTASTARCRTRSTCQGSS
jgi:type II secretory pathway pseudopilin PulG